jgi:tetratricopeptide (TPR) repeat protein
VSKDTDDPERRLHVLVQAARQMIDDRDTVGARAVLQQAMDYVVLTWGKDDVHLVGPLWLMAESFSREHDPLDPGNESEVACLQRAVAIARQSLSADHLEVARLAGLLGNHLVIAGKIDEGCALMLECLDIAHKNGRDDDFLRYLTGVAYARMEQGRPLEALAFFERAAIAYEHRGNQSSGTHAIKRVEFGKCLLALGRKREGLEQLHLALRILDANRIGGKNAVLMNEIMEMIDSVNREEA